MERIEIQVGGWSRTRSHCCARALPVSAKARAASPGVFGARGSCKFESYPAVPSALAVSGFQCLIALSPDGLDLAMLVPKILASAKTRVLSKSRISI